MLANVFGCHRESEPGCERRWAIHLIAIRVPRPIERQILPKTLGLAFFEARDDCDYSFARTWCALKHARYVLAHFQKMAESGTI